jgi:EAL domain-containing protein (putative c-di-GMP-specific phosphodiesterase class I)
MSVNLSARQFNRPDLAGSVAEVLRETGLHLRCLVLEITESTVMEDIDSAIDTLRELKELGIGIALDDFGTGYSSLSYLKRFPVDYLKIDRSFVDGLGRNPEDKGLVSAAVALARTLGLQTITEGAETAGQVEHLRELGCELVQVHYSWKPLPGNAAAALFATNGSRR